MEPTILNLGRYLEVTWRNIRTNRLTINEYVNRFFDKIDLFTSFFYENIEKGDKNKINLVCFEKWVFLCSPCCWESLKKKIDLLKKSEEGDKSKLEKLSSLKKIANEISEWVYIKKKHYFKEAIFISRLWNNYNNIALEELIYLWPILKSEENKEESSSKHESTSLSKLLFLSRGKESEEEREESVKECLKILDFSSSYSSSWESEKNLIKLKRLIKDHESELEKIFEECEEIYDFLNKKKAEYFWEDKKLVQIEFFLNEWDKIKKNTEKGIKKERGAGLKKLAEKKKEEEKSYDPILFPNITFSLLKPNSLVNSQLVTTKERICEQMGFLLLVGLILLSFFLLILSFTEDFSLIVKSLPFFKRKKDKKQKINLF